ncbi:hypothetical protein CAY57_08115 [Heyndrickxia coagulans]|nr:hypothetical protein CAY57_08115 [Heyndrickxia coagulans]
MDKRTGRNEYDRHWKRVIHSLFEDFVAFFSPGLYEMIDWDKLPDDLDKEFQKLNPDGKSRDREADGLFKVYLKDGSEQWILVHIEVQGWKDTGFAERMFQYFYRIFDAYDKKIFALVIYTEDYSETYTPPRYEHNFFGTKLSYEYNVYKIAEQDENELLQSTNPFAFVILAAKKALYGKTAAQPTKLELKKQLLRVLAVMKDRLQLDKKDLLTLFIFMDHMIKLESQYQQEFNQEIKNWEGGTMITYEDELKQEARKEGREEGREEGKREGRQEEKIEITRNLIKLGIPLDFIKKATGLSEKKILEIKEGLEKE